MEFNEFKNHLTFFKYVNNGPYPDENEEETLYSLNSISLNLII